MKMVDPTVMKMFLEREIRELEKIIRELKTSVERLDEIAKEK